MDDFEKAFSQYARPQASHMLKALLKNCYDSILKTPFNIEELKLSMLNLFTYLDSDEGKTNDNYWTVDMFMADYDGMWKPVLSGLPEKYKSIFDEIELLHGAVREPKFHTTAKQLIDLLNQTS